MPIPGAHEATTVIVDERSTAAGCAGVDDGLFSTDKTMLLVADAKRAVEDLVKAIG